MKKKNRKPATGHRNGFSQGNNSSSICSNCSTDATEQLTFQILRFWQLAGFQSKKNKDCEHLEYSISFPGSEAVARIFTTDGWIGIQFGADFESVSATKTHKIFSDLHPEIRECFSYRELYTLLITQAFPVKLADLIFRPDGIAIWAGVA
jgi:hypothetical protein